MNLHIPEDATFWEAAAGIEIAQSIPGMSVSSVDKEVQELAILGGLELGTDTESIKLAVSQAYRKVDDADKPYIQILAEESGLAIKLGDFRFPTIEPSNTGGIIICPYGATRSLELPPNVWKNVARLARTYDDNIQMLGSKRFELSSLTEADYLGTLPVKQRLQALADAKLIIGVPNEYTWMATAWLKKMIILYPDSIPQRRWFHFAHEKFGRIHFQTHALQIPVVLGAVRKLIRLLNKLQDQDEVQPIMYDLVEK